MSDTVNPKLNQLFNTARPEMVNNTPVQGQAAEVGSVDPSSVTAEMFQSLLSAKEELAKKEVELKTKITAYTEQKEKLLAVAKEKFGTLNLQQLEGLVAEGQRSLKGALSSINNVSTNTLNSIARLPEDLRSEYADLSAKLAEIQTLINPPRS